MYHMTSFICLSLYKLQQMFMLKSHSLEIRLSLLYECIVENKQFMKIELTKSATNRRNRMCKCQVFGNERICVDLN